MTERERITEVLRGGRPDRTPWATRLELWLASRRAADSMPPDLRGLDTMAAYRALGVGRQSYVDLARVRLRGVELAAELDGRPVYRAREPVIKYPIMSDLVPRSMPGTTTFTFRTPAGSAAVAFRTNQTVLDGGTLPYVVRHPIASEGDWAVAEWILDHCEVVADYAPFLEREREIGEHGLTIGTMDRTPFQRVLLDFMGEERAFFAMHDEPARFAAMLDRVTALARETVRAGIGSPALMVELTDNYDGEITNPGLFERFCLPFMRETREHAHAAGKVLGSHVDGDLSSLTELIAEGAMDVAESFSPEPLSRLTFSQAWEAWRGKVILWGCLASPLFEPETPEVRFEAEVRGVLAAARSDSGIVLGIADQAVGPTLPERIRRVRELVGP